MLQQEEQDDGPDVATGSVRHYVNSYKSFSEDLTNLLKLARSDHVTQGLADEIETLSNLLQFQIQECVTPELNLDVTYMYIENVTHPFKTCFDRNCRIYTEILKFAPSLTSDSLSVSQGTSSPLTIGAREFLEKLNRQVALNLFFFRISLNLVWRKNVVASHADRSSAKAGHGGDFAASPGSATNSQYSAPAQGKSATSGKKTEKVARDPKTGKGLTAVKHM